MRIYVELFSLLVGMEYGSMREKVPGYPLQLIIDEINELRRIKYIYPSIKISGRFLLALMLQSPQWMNLRLPLVSDNLVNAQSPSPSHSCYSARPSRSVRPPPVFKLGASPLEVVPPEVKDIIRRFLPHHDRCKVSLVSNPMLSININQVSSHLNASSRLRLELTIPKVKSLSIVQCIINGACQWLDQLSVYHLFLATISCASTAPSRFGPMCLFSPLRVPLPSSTFTDQYLIRSNNFIRPKCSHGDVEWRHLVQLQWDSPSGTRNRLIGGHGTFLRSASKKLHDLSRDYHEVTIPTQIIPVFPKIR